MRLLSLFLLGILSCSSFAADFAQMNIQYLTGKDYSKSSDNRDVTKKNIITFEHVSGWKYGDNFFFLDLTAPFETSATNNQSMYGEWHTRLSYTKIFGKKWTGIIKDISLAAEINFGRNSRSANRATLHGIGVDFNLPFFDVFAINFFGRNNNDQDLMSVQVSPYWLAHFNIGATSWEFNGFFDYDFGKDSREANYLFSPQILLDVGHFFKDDNHFHVGLEYNKWHNMFGIKDNNEDRIQFMGRWIL